MDRKRDLSDWFLTAAERGNPGTSIDSAHRDGTAWSEGNLVVPLVDGAAYMARLHEELASCTAGDRVHFTDWRGDADEMLRPGGPDVGSTLAALARKGVDVRGLVWRSHSDRLAMSAAENRELADEINEAGGEALLDERVRTFGSHHQKLFIIRRRAGSPEGPGDRADGSGPGGPAAGEGGDVAFVGGIDLCHGRRDDSSHRGDPQARAMDRRYGPRPAWHDAQLEVRGPAVGDLVHTFRERWDDPTPLDHKNAFRAALSRATGRARRTSELPDMLHPPDRAGPHAVQVLRTYPDHRLAYPFAPKGERSVARAYAKALARARSLVYVEDQYLWSVEVARVMAAAMRSNPGLRLIAVVPRFPDQDGKVSGPPSLAGQHQALELVREAGGDRFAVYDIESAWSLPIYVHAKVCIVDDVWASVGSDNFNLRSWTHDSELSCAVVDSTLDAREPTDPGGLGDGARRYARELRLRLWSEHLGLDAGDERLVGAEEGAALWREKADEVDAWHAAGSPGEHPAPRVRHHVPARLGHLTSLWANPLYRLVFDPDGRPQEMRRSGEL
ncbi:MAG: phospholipase D family protein [Acidimicrobiales bacterium]